MHTIEGDRLRRMIEEAREDGAKMLFLNEFETLKSLPDEVLSLKSVEELRISMSSPHAAYRTPWATGTKAFRPIGV
ncbi:MAG: hypothetical protein R3F65_19660 [bacterium]